MAKNVLIRIQVTNWNESWSWESSVADPGSWFLPIPDSGSRIQKNNKRGGWKKLVVILFLVATNFTKLKIIFFFNAEENNLAQFSKNYRTFYLKVKKKLSVSSQKYRFGSKGTGSRIRIRNTVGKLTGNGPGPGQNGDDSSRLTLPGIAAVCTAQPAHQTPSVNQHVA